jgi:hypothetical protein
MTGLRPSVRQVNRLRTTAVHPLRRRLGYRRIRPKADRHQPLASRVRVPRLRADERAVAAAIAPVERARFNSLPAHMSARVDVAYAMPTRWLSQFGPSVRWGTNV